MGILIHLTLLLGILGGLSYVTTVTLHQAGYFYSIAKCATSVNKKFLLIHS